MSAAEAGPAAAVTKPGKCDRTVWIGKDTHVIKHNWRLDAARGQVLLVTKLVNSRVHVTETWIFASEDMKHDCDFHMHGLAKMADYYLRGDGSGATAGVRKNGRTPRMHRFTDGCGKQYKGRRSFRFLAGSVRPIGFFIDHHFAATSHFKGCNDGIGGVAKNAMKRRERYGKRIMGADGVVSFLQSFFRERGGEGEGEEGMRKYFAAWSLYRIRKVHVELIRKHEIYRRPGSALAGIVGTRDMYHFTGTNTPKNDVATTTSGLQDHELVLKREEGRRFSRREKELLETLGGVKVISSKGRWKDVQAEELVSGAEKVLVRKVVGKYLVRTRVASCFCSSCQISRYDECHVNRVYPALVPQLVDGEVKETVMMDTGVEPVGVDEPQ